MSKKSQDTRDAYDTHGIEFMQLRGHTLQPVEEQLASQVLRMAREHQPAADEPIRVVDVGVGYGKFLGWWQKQTNVLAVGGDNSRQMLRLAAQRNGVSHNQLQQFDAASLPFADNSVMWFLPMLFTITWMILQRLSGMHVVCRSQAGSFMYLCVKETSAVDGMRVRGRFITDTMRSPSSNASCKMPAFR